MIDGALLSTTTSLALQQKDNLCGPFHVARVLVEAGVTEWDGMPIDQDLVALHAGTTLPANPRGRQVPVGATSLQDYRHELPRVDSGRAGTSAAGLARAISVVSSGRLECVPLQGSWRADVVERLVESGPRLGANLIANIRTGPLWSSRPPVEALLAELAGGRLQRVPASEWDVGHFVELIQLLRGSAGTL